MFSRNRQDEYDTGKNRGDRDGGNLPCTILTFRSNVYCSNFVLNSQCLNETWFYTLQLKLALFLILKKNI